MGPIVPKIQVSNVITQGAGQLFYFGVGCVKDDADRKGPLKIYVILLGGGGEVTKRLQKITRGKEGYAKRLHWITRGGGQFGSTVA